MALQLMLNRLQDFEKLITHTFPLTQANETIRVMKRKEGLKAVLFPHE
jgi:threonine dehydrogenase-like Zn-dependent dehydrogenase